MKDLKKMTIDELAQEKIDIENDHSINHLTRKIGFIAEVNRRAAVNMQKSTKSLTALNEGITRFCNNMKPHEEACRSGIAQMRARRGGKK
jgi:hypothetical protein